MSGNGHQTRVALTDRTEVPLRELIPSAPQILDQIRSIPHIQTLEHRFYARIAAAAKAKGLPVPSEPADDLPDSMKERLKFFLAYRSYCSMHQIASVPINPIVAAIHLIGVTYNIRPAAVDALEAYRQVSIEGISTSGVKLEEQDWMWIEFFNESKRPLASFKSIREICQDSISIDWYPLPPERQAVRLQPSALQHAPVHSQHPHLPRASEPTNGHLHSSQSMQGVLATLIQLPKPLHQQNLPILSAFVPPQPSLSIGVQNSINNNQHRSSINVQNAQLFTHHQPQQQQQQQQNQQHSSQHQYKRQPQPLHLQLNQQQPLQFTLHQNLLPLQTFQTHHQQQPLSQPQQKQLPLPSQPQPKQLQPLHSQQKQPLPQSLASAPHSRVAEPMPVVGAPPKSPAASLAQPVTQKQPPANLHLWPLPSSHPNAKTNTTGAEATIAAAKKAVELNAQTEALAAAKRSAESRAQAEAVAAKRAAKNEDKTTREEQEFHSAIKELESVLELARTLQNAHKTREAKAAQVLTTSKSINGNPVVESLDENQAPVPIDTTRLSKDAGGKENTTADKSTSNITQPPDIVSKASTNVNSKNDLAGSIGHSNSYSSILAEAQKEAEKLLKDQRAHLMASNPQMKFATDIRPPSAATKRASQSVLTPFKKHPGNVVKNAAMSQNKSKEPSPTSDSSSDVIIVEPIKIQPVPNSNYMRAIEKSNKRTSDSCFPKASKKMKPTKKNKKSHSEKLSARPIVRNKKFKWVLVPPPMKIAGKPLTYENWKSLVDSCNGY